MCIKCHIFQIPVIADLPVGLNMQDHPGAPVFFVFNRDIPKVTQKITDPANVAEYIHNRTGKSLEENHNIRYFCLI